MCFDLDGSSVGVKNVIIKTSAINFTSHHFTTDIGPDRSVAGCDLISVGVVVLLLLIRIHNIFKLLAERCKDSKYLTAGK